MSNMVQKTFLSHNDSPATFYVQVDKGKYCLVFVLQSIVANKAAVEQSTQKTVTYFLKT